MPRGDKTGPEGKGSMTGRQQGYCAGNDSPGYAVGQERGLGRGLGRGRRFGRDSEYNPRGEPRPRNGSGRGNGNFAEKPVASGYQNSKEILEKLGNIEKRLDELDK